MFKKGDWVQITPTPDLRWNTWRNSQDIYKDFLDRIGSIESIADDDERPGELLYAVRVNFPDGLGHLGPGHYYEWFRGEHLILSSESTAKLRDNMIQAGKELQEWEKFKKKTTDNMLKKIFAPEPKQEEKIKNKKDDPNQWELEGSRNNKYDEKYDTYYDDDYKSYTFQYTNNTDVDYPYYSDTSDDDKQDDKD
jgi:hypothetical protein